MRTGRAARLAIAAGAAIASLALLTVPPAQAFATLTVPQAQAFASQARSWGAANLITYADSDFEGKLGIWVARTNTTLVDDATTAFLHSDSMKMTATAAGSQVASMGTGANATRVNVTAGAVYRVSEWVKTQGGSGRTLTEGLGFYNSAGTWIGWGNATQTLAASTGWQYVSGTITAPAGAATFVGSPKLTEAGVSAGETLNVDEMLVEPYRAATIIGAIDPGSNGTQFAAANSAIGPLQSDRIYYSPTQALPASYSGSRCAALPVNVTCVISYKVQTTNVANYVASIPAGKNVILIWWHEPENDTFSGSGANGQNFVADFKAQSNLIRASTHAANRANVFVAMNAMTYQYAAGTNHNLGGAGGACSFIPPAQYVDMYLADPYEFVSSGKNVSADRGSQAEWNGWLNCVKGQNKPLGVAEQGDNCSASPDFANSATTPATIAADAAYFQSQPAGLPFLLWEYWDNPAGWTGGNCQFTTGSPPDGTQAVNQWKANETLNGGGAN